MTQFSPTSGVSLHELQGLQQLFPDLDRRPYYIVAPEFSRFSAGIKVMHQLCNLLNLRGQSAFLTTSTVNPDLVTPTLNEQIVEQHFRDGRTPIVVYPEILCGNPLNGNCVVRYLLNVPGLLGGPSEYSPDDFLLWYAEGYRQSCAGVGPILFLPVTDARMFRPPPAGTRRQGSCFYAGKFRLLSGEDFSPITSKSVEIHAGFGANVQTREDILALFQLSELFYSYESSALGLEALLCGCPVVFIPNKHMPEFLPSAPFGTAGMAWGTSAEEIERAKRTVPEVPARYAIWVEQAFQELDEFIDLTQKKAHGLPYAEKIHLVDPFKPPVPPESAMKKGLKLIVPPIITKLRNELSSGGGSNGRTR